MAQRMKLWFAFMLMLPICTGSIARPAEQSDTLLLSLEVVVHELSLSSPAATIKKLGFRNALLEFENYKGGALINSCYAA